MSKKSRGIAAERDFLHQFWAQGREILRVAGSGSIRYPSVDLIAGNAARKLAIECKTTKSRIKYISDDDIGQLESFSKLFGAESWIAVKFEKQDWFFLFIEDLRKSGSSHAVDVDLAKAKGLLFEELIK